MSVTLGDVLDPRVTSRGRQTTPLPGEPNTLCIMALTIYHKSEGVYQKITRIKMAQVMDFPVYCTEKKKEVQLRLLIDNDIPGKCNKVAIF